MRPARVASHALLFHFLFRSPLLRSIITCCVVLGAVAGATGANNRRVRGNSAPPAFNCASLHLDTAPVKIMPIGNSITQAAAGRNSYRRPLWQKLTTAGYNVDFVGSVNLNYGGPPLNPDFDMDHEGHWGWRADQLLAGMANWAKTYRPDIALLHVGTNDMFQGHSVSSTLDEISQLIDTLRAANPGVTILLATLIPAANVEYNLRINELNSALPGLATAKNRAGSPVVLVNQNAGFNAASDTYDGTHPNSLGENKMANVWYNSLVQFLPPVEPSPNMPPGISLMTPASNDTYTAPASISFTATASDNDGQVTKVEFFAGALKLGESTAAPWSFTWNNASEGNYALTARVTDNGGAATTSEPVGITIRPAPAPAPTDTVFYRGINLNGDAITLDGNNWAGKTATNYTTNGGGFVNTTMALVPSTDQTRTAMIRSSV